MRDRLADLGRRRARRRDAALALRREPLPDFVFDNQILAQVLWSGAGVAEVTCPTKYFEEASSINFARSVRYGFGCLGTAAHLFLARRGLASHPRYPAELRDRFAGSGERA